MFRDIRRSTPFRLTLQLTAIFTASMLGCFAAAFWVIRSYLDTDLHAQVTQELATWQNIAGETELRDRLAEAIATSAPRTVLVSYRGDDGTRIENVPNLAPVEGFRVITARKIGIEPRRLADSYLVNTSRVAGGILTLGYDRDKVAELVEIFSMVILLGVLPTLGLAGALGLVTAQLARRRVEAIDDALGEMTAGDLAARVPGVTGGGDDLDRIGAAVNRMASAQAASVATLKQVSADIAHDLKTPIQRVSVLLDLIEGAGPMSEAQSAALDRARGETRQIVSTFQSLLQIAQIEGGGPRARFEPVDLGALVSGIAEVYGPAAEDSGHRLIVQVPAAAVTVQGDRNLLNQIVANLIENGIRHTPKGGLITLALTPEAELTVTDDGPGIPPEERDKVLRRLYRLERSRTTEGSGLGLALVAAIADLHRAKLTLEDAEPGLRVRIRFVRAA